MTLITFLTIVCFGIIWADRFTPWEDFKNWIGFGKKQKEIKLKNKYINYIYHFIHSLLNCYCISAWIVFFATWNVFMACAAYIVAELIYVIIDWFKNNTFYS